MKAFLILSLLALPLSSEVRGAARGGIFEGAENDPVGTIELDARLGGWSVAPAYDFIRGGYGVHAIHVDLRRHFRSETYAYWIGTGPTFVRSNEYASETTWNIDGGVARRTKSSWEPFIAARYYRFHLPVFRDVLEGNGAVISIGISRRFF